MIVDYKDWFPAVRLKDHLGSKVLHEAHEVDLASSVVQLKKTMILETVTNRSIDGERTASVCVQLNHKLLVSVVPGLLLCRPAVAACLIDVHDGEAF